MQAKKQKIERPTGTVTMSKPTIYTNVLFRGQRGKVRLTEEKIAFKPDRWKQHKVYDSWRWTAVLKHQVNSKSSRKALLKLISSEDSTKCVIFQVENHQVLDQLRNDVSDRLRKTRRAARKDSLLGESNNEFQQGHQSSDMSYTTVSVKDGASNVGSSRSAVTFATETEKHRREQLLRADTEKRSNRRRVLLLDPQMDLSPPDLAPTFVATPDSTKSGSSATEERNTTKISSAGVPLHMSPFLATVVLGCALILAFHKAASFGYINGVTDRISFQERIFPRSLPKRSQYGLSVDDVGFCLWDNQSAVKNAEMKFETAADALEN